MHAMDFAADSLLLIIISFSLYTDLKVGKIYNFVTLPSMAAGIIFNSLKYQTDSIHVGFLNSVFGLLLAYVVFIVPYFMGALGAGDVKLLMAIGALKGPHFMFISILAIGVASFLLSLLVICVDIANKYRLAGLVNMIIMFFNSFVMVKDDDIKPFLKKNLKFGISIFFGTIIAYVYCQLK